jgi:hypothetical protein
MSKARVAVCFFGVLDRSIRFTIPQITKLILDPLRENYDVILYGFNLHVGSSLVDGQPVRHGNWKCLDLDVVQEERQDEIDLEIERIMSPSSRPAIRMRSDYTADEVVNTFRQMYSEEKVGNWLDESKDKIDAAVVCGPDFYPTRMFDPGEIETVRTYPNRVLTTWANPGQGFTNGFYVGKAETLAKVMRRYSCYHHFFPTDKDYEHILCRSFEMNKVEHGYSKMMFFKIRNDGTAARQGMMRRPEWDEDCRRAEAYIHAHT